MSQTVQTQLSEFEKGDEILFNDRKQPLTVTRVWDSVSGMRSVYVEGPRGGSYKIRAGDEFRDPTVERVVETYDGRDYVDEEDLDSVELVTPAAKVPAPVEIGDEFKKQTTLDCVSYTGEWWGYRVTDIDQENQQITYEIVSVPESCDGTEWVTEKTVHYQEFQDKVDLGWESVDDLDLDADAEPNRDMETGERIETSGVEWVAACEGCGHSSPPFTFQSAAHKWRSAHGCESPDTYHGHADAVDVEDDREEIVTDGGWVTDDRSDWCDSCQRYRIDCAHSADLAADGGAVDVAKSSASGSADMEYEERAEELVSTTALKRREADVQALKESGLSHSEIAEELDLSKSTVDEYSRRINDRLKRARATLDEIE